MLSTNFWFMYFCREKPLGSIDGNARNKLKLQRFGIF